LLCPCQVELQARRPADPAKLPLRLSRACAAADAAAAGAAAPAAAAGGGPGAEDPEPPAPAAAPAGQLDVIYAADVANSMGLTPFMVAAAAVLGAALPVVFVRKRRSLGRAFL
jgi:hypothetical protein